MRSFKILNYVVLLFVFTLFPAISYAHPPTSIDLAYNIKDQVLSVEAVHVSRNLDKEYIRKVMIYKNEEEPEVYYFHRQDRPSRFEKDFNLQAEVGDEIRVVLYASEGGEKSATLEVTKPKDEGEGTNDNE